MTIRLAKLLPLLLLIGAGSTDPVRIFPETGWANGFDPGIAVRGLTPGETVRIHAFRPFQRWDKMDGKWVSTATLYHGWADVRADASGVVEMDRAVVGAGTYRGIDGYGLIWSMRRPTDPAVAGTRPAGLKPVKYTGGTRIVVTRGSEILADTMLVSRDPPNLDVETIADGALNGVFAAPKSGRNLPTIILLHGSEGGGSDSARAQAVRFAGQGYAAFALNYFAWDMQGLKGVPNTHINLPIELIDRVRQLLVARREVDGKRIALYGHSKGAEYAEVAAIRYPWVKAVVACVPTDVVWEGYGIGDERAKQPPDFVAPKLLSSWSWRGKPLPYVPLKPWSENPDRGYFDNAGRYEMGRSANPLLAARAAIPIERSSARFLLLGSGRDEVWTSGAMAKHLAARMAQAGKGSRIDIRVYPRAGHLICGTGDYSAFAWAEPSSDPRVKEPVAEGEAALDAWKATKAFLRRVL